MEYAQYVNKIGKQINTSIKMSSNPDDVSITGLVLIKHLTEVYNWVESKLSEPDTEYTSDDLKKIERYINCLKKEMRFYPDMVIDSDCILTEKEEHIIQE